MTTTRTSIRKRRTFSIAFWTVFILVAIAVPAYLLYLGYDFLSRPNHRSYYVENMHGAAFIDSSGVAKYTYLQFGSHREPLTETPQTLFVENAEGRLALHELSGEQANAAGKHIRPVLDYDEHWPEGTMTAVVAGCNVYMHDGRILSMSVGPHAIANYGMRLSKDGERWFSPPFDQQAIEVLLGPKGRVSDGWHK